MHLSRVTTHAAKSFGEVNNISEAENQGGCTHIERTPIWGYNYLLTIVGLIGVYDMNRSVKSLQTLFFIFSINILRPICQRAFNL
jgi:hypothetical protein